MIVNLRATVSGMAGSGGGADSLMAMLDTEVGTLMIDTARTEPRGVFIERPESDETVVLVTDPAAADGDIVFGDANYHDAIRDYYALQARGLLILDDAVARFNPASKVEPDKVDEGGRKFRVHPDINNGQMAVIALAWLAARQRDIGAQIDAAEDDALSLTTLTVGLPAGYRAFDTTPGMVPRLAWE